MVGGTVIGLARKLGSTLLHVEDGRGDRAAIRVIERRSIDSRCVEIELGDTVWFHQDGALWTPLADGEAKGKPGIDFNIRLPLLKGPH